MNKRYKKVILDNGIRLYVHSDKTMRKTLVSYTVDYGHNGIYYDFNYDGKDYHVLPGVAHFLEHLLLEKSPYGNLYNYFLSLKYNSNASTSVDRTMYYFTGVSRIKTSIKKMIYSIEKPQFNDEDIKDTSHAIEEETKRFADDPYFLALINNIRNSYKNFEFVHECLNVIGNEETTKKIDYDTLKLCYDAFYSDDRKIITITGPIDEDDMINYIKKLYKGIKPHKNKTKVYRPDNILEVRKKNDILKKDIEDDSIYIGYNAYLENYSKFEIEQYLRFMSLSKFSTKTKFYKELNNKQILINSYGIDTVYPYYDNNVNFFFEFRIRNKDLFLKEFHKELYKNEFNEYDFELFKKSIISNDILRDEDKYTYYYALPDNVLFHGEAIDKVEATKNLTFDKFIEFYNKLDFSNEVITLLTKED